MSSGRQSHLCTSGTTCCLLACTKRHFGSLQGHQGTLSAYIILNTAFGWSGSVTPNKTLRWCQWQKSKERRVEQTEAELKWRWAFWLFQRGDWDNNNNRSELRKVVVSASGLVLFQAAERSGAVRREVCVSRVLMSWGPGLQDALWVMDPGDSIGRKWNCHVWRAFSRFHFLHSIVCSTPHQPHNPISHECTCWAFVFLFPCQQHDSW